MDLDYKNQIVNYDGGRNKQYIFFRIHHFKAWIKSYKRNSLLHRTLERMGLLVLIQESSASEVEELQNSFKGFVSVNRSVHQPEPSRTDNRTHLKLPPIGSVVVTEVKPK